MLRNLGYQLMGEKEFHVILIGKQLQISFVILIENRKILLDYISITL